MVFDFDLTYFPTTIDMLHGGLAAVAIVELFLLVFLLTVVVIGLVRKSTAVSPRTGKGVEPEAPKAVKRAATISERQAAVKPRPEKKPEPAPGIMKESSPDAALQLLGLMQQEARFIDFIEENIAGYSDTDIGAAARIVHEGCHKVLSAHFELEPIRTEPENKRITLQAGFDPSAVRLTGNIVGKPPFAGTLVHRGWRVTNVKLPKIAENHDVNIIAPAEVEL
jgi:Domain of unknown function (DUF2760)